eukprot:s548_g22.t1
MGRTCISWALPVSVVLVVASAQQDCTYLICPSGHTPKIRVTPPLCKGQCDVAVDLYTCCDQLCSDFSCRGASELKANSSEIVCRGQCDKLRDRSRCCDILPVQDERLQLLRASVAGKASQVDRLVSMSVDTHLTLPGGAGGLHFAALHGHTQNMRRLIDGRADVNAVDALGWAPLHLAAGAGRIGAMNLLIDSRAIPDIRSGDGLEPLDVARQAAQSPRVGQGQKDLAVLLARRVRAWRDELNLTQSS